MSEDVLAVERPATTFRAATPVVLFYLCVAVVGGASALVGWWLDLTWLPGALGLVAAVALVALVNSLVGRAELGADSVRVRRLVGGTTVAADQVVSFTVRTTPYGRHVRMDRYVKGAVRLPAPDAPWPLGGADFDAQVSRIAAWAEARPPHAPTVSRDGGGRPWLYPVLVAAVLVAAALPDRPWGWVSFNEVGALPNMCQAVAEAAEEVLGADAELAIADVRFGEHDCRWDNGSWSLALAARVYPRSGLHSGSSIAATTFTRDHEFLAEPSAGRSIRLPGFADLGDEAQATAADTAVLGMVRQANVVIAILLMTTDPDVADPLDDTDHENVLSLGRAAVAVVDSA